ncbi:hypothetical protein FNV43_RR11136 [Rhamnella rubrinervis]|uniref:Uncharacterized protein n=1 Tax=Rhamnella rubrinervis TaxID=2594499 RepID=A0A8K0H5E8_9ROSA|nr:hypothetical protein FNV43_RR11136 [Rhamnella rubrinervis]
MQLIRAHNLSLPILLHRRDLCRDSIDVDFDLLFLLDNMRRLASLFYLQQHRHESLDALERLAKEKDEQRQWLDDKIVAFSAQHQALHDA